MQRKFAIVRPLAAIAAVAIVGGTILSLGSYSNEKFERVAASAAPSFTADMARVPIQPSQVDVVAIRQASTRTAAHAEATQVPRPQS